MACYTEARRQARRKARRNRSWWKRKIELAEREMRIQEEYLRAFQREKKFQEQVGYALELMSGWRLAWTGVKKIFKGGFSI